MIFEEIEELLNNATSKAGYDEKLSVTFSNMPKMCDFQCNDCFSLAKKYGKNPFEIAEDIVSKIENTQAFVFEVARPAFINIKLTDKKLSDIGNDYLKDPRGGLAMHITQQKVLLDYGGANVAKSLHVGHLRPAIIGESLKRLYRLLGDQVISDVHLGDWGLQMGLTELELFEEDKLDYYFGKSKTPYHITIEDLNYAYPRASIRKNQEEDFRKKAETWTYKIQNKEEPYYSIFKELRELSVSEIKKNYASLGAEFDLWYGESDASDYIPEVLKIIKDKGLARESEGALVVDVAREGENIPLPKKEGEVQRYSNPMPPCIIEKSNGAVLYATTDIATIYMRNKMFKNLDRIEYVTDARQHLHFTQVFRVSKLAEISPEEQQLLHIGHGTMNGRDGKPFKTRSGETIKLEDIIEMLVEKAGEKLKSNGLEFDRDLALKIGVAAMKFGDLINNVDKDYVFDLDKFMAFEGKTGPYLQYTAVRINSILNKVKDLSQGEFIVDNDEEREIIKCILKLNSSYEICYKNKTLSPLCLATYNLASAFSSFYNNYNVINEQDKKKQASYVSLLNLVKNKLAQALNVLAIEVPEKM